MRRLLAAALYAAGLAGEVVFAQALFAGEVGVALVALHLFAAVACGAAVAGLSPKRVGGGRLAVFVAAATAAVPLLGAVGTGLAVLGSAAWPRRRDLPETILPVPMLDLPERGPSAPAPPRLGAASAYGRLRHSRSIGDRMDVLVAMKDIDDRAAVPVLKLAQKDKADEVRLLAFTILQEREREYYADIHTRKDRLFKGAVGEEAAIHHLRIAQAYWELAYQDLVQGELLTYALDEAAMHLSKAMADHPPDAGNTLLFGRIRLRQGKVVEARRLFNEAAALGLPDGVVCPYQAEAAFQVRDFAATRACLAVLPPEARSLAVLGELVEFWV